MSSPRPEVCVGAVVLHGDRLLLVKRGRGAGVGSWSIPGGRVEFGETLHVAVCREVLEETGVAISNLRYLGHVERVSSEWHYVIHDFVAQAESPIDPVAGDDAEEAIWVERTSVRGWNGLVPGLADFLAEHDIIE